MDRHPDHSKLAVLRGQIQACTWRAEIETLASGEIHLHRLGLISRRGVALGEWSPPQRTFETMATLQAALEAHLKALEDYLPVG